MQSNFSAEEWAAVGVIDIYDNDDPTYDPDFDTYCVDMADDMVKAYEASFYRNSY